MSSRCQLTVPLLLLLTGVLASGLRAGAEEEPGLDTLMANSPFGAPRTGKGTAVENAAPLEFHGVEVEGAQRFYGVSEAVTHRFFWLRENETAEKITVLNFDERASVLRVQYQGSALNLAIKSVKHGGARPAAAAGQSSVAGGDAVVASARDVRVAEARKHLDEAQQARLRQSLEQVAERAAKAQ